MRLARFYVPKTNISAYGLVEENSIKPIEGSVFGKIKLTKNKYLLSEIRLLAPVLPSKIILVGLNYKDHAQEMGLPLPSEPIIFLKPTTSLIGPYENIVYPSNIKELDYEAELAVVIKKKAHNIREDKANDCILGYTCLNDVTARDLQRKDAQWTRSKSFDTFCPVGPFIETALNPSKLEIKLYLNDEIKQESNTRNLIFHVTRLVNFISGIMTLLPGDIIATGTPPGVGPMKIGDTVKVEIEGIGALTNKVVR